MKKVLYCLRTSPLRAASALALLLVGASAGTATAAIKTWDGGGADSSWTNAVNWDANLAPGASDALIFTLNTRVVNTNLFAAGTAFNGISFLAPAGAFTLWGNSVTLGGNITNNQALVTETINLPLILSGNRTVDVGNNAALTLGGVVSGSGFGLVKTGSGLLTLGAANTFSGSLAVNAGTVSVASDGNLGAAPGAATPGSVVINNGTLRSTANVTVSPNRGIAVGPAAGSGPGRLDVNSGTTLTYRGIIANNGGTGSLTKGGFGGLTVSSASTYSGATDIKVGTVTLDFTQTAAPVSPNINVINGSSPLSLGGENAGLGTLSQSVLIMNGRASIANTQSFASTFVDIGPAIVRANSGAGGSARINLNALTHNVGGVLAVIPPAAGSINTTTLNTYGILGGWATISDGTTPVGGLTLSTNFAMADGSGNIVNYTGYTNYVTGARVANAAVYPDGPATNLRINGNSTGSILVDTAEVGTTTDINTINFSAASGRSIRIGNNNTLRLGRYGSVFRSDATTAAITWVLGESDGGANGVQDSGTLTAGGAPNTPGEIVFHINAPSQTAGSLNCEVKIADNGTGPVTLIKTGPGSMKLRGHNTHSGGSYALQGRFQIAGSEIGTANLDAFGTGPVYVMPGAQLFPSGATGGAITNELFIAGLGFGGGSSGAIRMSSGVQTFAGQVNLIGDAFISGGGVNNSNGRITGRITGPFSFGIGQSGGGEGFATFFRIYNQNNDWTGNTVISSRNAGSAATLVLGNSNVIPDGVGKGSVVFAPQTTGATTLDLFGFNETINGMSVSTAATGNAFVQNSDPSQTSTLTVGNNDASSTFAGVVRDNGGILALTKIGGGEQVLSGANSYSGDTTVQGGTLTISGDGSLSSPVIKAQNSTFNVAGVNAGSFAAAGAVQLTNSTFVAGKTAVTAQSLNLTNSQLTVVLDPNAINFNTTTLTNGGTTNRVNISAVLNISGYPTAFTLIKYTGSVQGVGNNFGIGEVPSAATVGYISNDVANARIVLVLLNGPKPVTWAGNHPTNPTYWDEGITTNWLAFKGTGNEAPAAFFTADFAIFDDTGSTGIVDVRSPLAPGGLTVNNGSLDYTFTGSGLISGQGGLNKQGGASLTFDNAGSSSFSGGVVVNGGKVTFARDHTIAGGTTIASGAVVQVGTNNVTGSLPAGNVANEGSLFFNRTANLTVAGIINGEGSITNSGTGAITLGGANTFNGAVSINAGTVRAGTATALGTALGITVIESGGTLDVNEQQLNTEPVIVSGAGVGNAGAIINGSVNQQLNAMGNITMKGHTTFGGAGRWDIRGGIATLSTEGNAYNLTKVSSNQVSLVAVNVDGALANIFVGGGMLSLETTTTSLGNPASLLVVSNGATLQFFNTTTAWDKVFILNGNTFSNTLLSAAGANTVAGAVTLNSNCLFSVGGTSLTMNGAIGGSGSLTKLGAAPLILNGNNPYTGGTTNTAGTLLVNGLNNGGGVVTNLPGSSFGGRGTNTGAVFLGTNATLLPGGVGVAGSLGTGPLLLNSAQTVFDLGTNDVNNVSPVNDLVFVNGNLTLTGITTNTIVPGPIGVLTNGQTITLFQYSGSLIGGTNNLRLVSQAGYEFVFLDPATTPGLIQAKITAAPAFLTWSAQTIANRTAWDIATTLNWLEGAANSDFLNFDAVTFTDTSNTNRADLIGNLQPTIISMNNSAKTYTFAGTGKLTGLTRLDVQGGGTLIVANSGSNDFTGPVNITSGTLQIGDGTANGNLGSGSITNQGNLIFNRSGTLAVNSIHGSGPITNVGSGVVTVGGANTYDSALVVQAGTIRAGSGTALGSALAGTTVANGATLDVNGQTLTLEPVVVSGSGVGNNGAIVNNGTDTTTALGNVTLEGHTVFGGTGRWDIRGGAQTLSTLGNPYNLTKIGSNQISLVGVLVDGALADISVQGGIFAAETTTSSLGNPANTFTLSAGATFQLFNSVAAFDKIFILNGNGVANTINCSSGIGNYIVGPVTISGACIFNVTGANALTMGGSIGGSGSLIKTTTGTLNLSGLLSYTGNTTVNGGALVVSAAASLTNSPVITLGAGTVLDVTGLSSGPALALISGQTLQGHGTINGSLSVAAGATVAPGTSAGQLTVTNDVTIAGKALMEINKAANTNDRIRSILGSITYGGTLTVTNIGGTLVGGESFKLFDSLIASYLGSFTTIQLPPLGPGLSWNTSQLAVTGTISVTGTLVPPTIISTGTSGGNLVFSGTGGIPNGPYVVVTSTNVTLPVITWTRLSTNAFDNLGGFSFSTAIDPNTASRFYRLLLP